MKLARFLLPKLRDAITPGKVLILYGPRQVGKTTLVTDLLAETSRKAQLITADELRYREALASQDARTLGSLLGDNELLIIDEAQRVENIGLNLKILVDRYPHAAFVATGSASFELANRVSEPLTGRTLTFHLYPVSYGELRKHFGSFETREQLERWLIWGGYPEIVTETDLKKREQYIGELVGSYLNRDLRELVSLRKPEKIVDLLRMLAFQIGQEVSIAELATHLAINRQTVERYLDLLEKAFVIFRVRGFSRNLRKEVTKNARYFFYDNGVRNALIQNFNPMHLRADLGQLWENFLVVERQKTNAFVERSGNIYFWRTYDQKEIDYLEERSAKVNGFEFKWQGGIKRATEREFMRSYPGADLQSITKENFEEFLLN